MILTHEVVKLANNTHCPYGAEQDDKFQQENKLLQLIIIYHQGTTKLIL